MNIQKLYIALRAEMTKVVVGQEEVFQHLVIALLAGGHVLLEGVPGLGKTLLAHTLASALQLSFSRIQFTPDLMPADIVGTMVLHEKEGGGHELRFESGPLVANFILADEINRATPKTQSALLEAMQERQISVARRTMLLPKPFIVVATQNFSEDPNVLVMIIVYSLITLFVIVPLAGELGKRAKRQTGAG